MSFKGLMSRTFNLGKGKMVCTLIVNIKMMYFTTILSSCTNFLISLMQVSTHSVPGSSYLIIGMKGQVS